MRLILALILIFVLFSALGSCMFHPYGYYGGAYYHPGFFYWHTPVYHYHYHYYPRYRHW